MSDWPDGRTDERGRYGRGSTNAEPEGARAMPHVRRTAPPRQYQPVPGYDEGTAVTDHASGGRRDDGYNTGQVYGPGGPAGPGRGGHGGHGGGPRGGAPRTTPPNWRKRITVGLTAFVVVLLAVSVGTYFWADSKLRREVDLGKVQDRPAAGEGTNYLIVGSDSREGLSDEDKKELHTGSADGKRTDSMMILHTGDNGTTMLSLPRDSYVTIPAFTGKESGKRFPASTHKLNQAYADGGPELLAQTIEFNTGLRIDHYAEIGFGGFRNLVDALGGVEMCLDKPLKDRDSGADFKAGCQELDGAQSLAFVRQRHQEADQDLGRMRNQQKFLNTLAKQAASPSTVLNPFRLYPVIGSGLDTLIVDKDMGLFDLTSMFWAMKGVTGGDGKQLTVPIASANFPTRGDGVAVKWDTAKAKQLFDQLKKDQKVTAG
ncbi:LCP family protein [Streptomyces albireticuli]|uniref:Transcriptional regulator n=1 Tax=Streptomyces albireticuli TaxID=1940 RepID=A0A2A2D520_9ACTN|nr:LCP family protein [Streptomyces albireticuli]MCD9144595.1 LCP family protein [Streptomyces albireticuli]MCD9163342.1 LCP family protein [Streptomyces albireticuli]MCD9193273.1 LCP family protein [Streptomyces albireticuli]PAU46611.1 transcriptional regulator [Streptomyces albireticuli]